MKTKIFFLSLLTITATMALTGCSSEVSSTETPQVVSTPKNEVQTIEYTVTVNGGATTRATVADDPSDATNYHKTLYFAAGDKLYLASESRSDLKGLLTLKAGDEGKSSGVTFEGTISYTGEAPATDLMLKATLVGSSNAGIAISEGKVTGITYPNNAFCADVNEAVQKYSMLIGESTYGTRSFSLTQQTAFLNFTATFKDGTGTGAGVTATVANGSSTVCTATVTTKEVGGNVVAQFVLPVAVGTTLSSAYVEVGSARFTFGGSEPKTLVGKVYNVARYVTELSKATKDDIGKVADADGKLYDKVSGVPDGKTALAMVAYVGHDSNCDNGLAIALTDVNVAGLYYDYAIASATTWNNPDHPVSGGTWRVPSVDDWKHMFTDCGGSSYSADLSDNMEYKYGQFRAKLIAIGGTDVKNNSYWTSTKSSIVNTKAWIYNFDKQKFWASADDSKYVRLCLSF